MPLLLSATIGLQEKGLQANQCGLIHGCSPAHQLLCDRVAPWKITALFILSDKPIHRCVKGGVSWTLTSHHGVTSGCITQSKFFCASSKHTQKHHTPRSKQSTNNIKCNSIKTVQLTQHNQHQTQLCPNQQISAGEACIMAIHSNLLQALKGTTLNNSSLNSRTLISASTVP